MGDRAARWHLASANLNTGGVAPGARSESESLVA
jgi:hypothetical protein